MSEMLEQQREYVLRSVEERGVRLIRLWFTDVLGSLKSFAISPAELENALDDGMTFDGSSIDGFSRIQEADVLAMPDPDTFEVLPWGDAKTPEARVFCDIHNLDGTPFGGDPRQVLRRHVRACHEQGLTFYVAPDIEFFYFSPPDPGQQPQPLDEGSFFDLTTNDIAGSLRKQTIRTLEAMGIPVEYSFHEDAPSQHEIDLRHTDALTMADSVMTFRLIVREVAASHGLHATFMPKPLEGVQGSGMHTHLSLFRGDDNAFFDEADDYYLSPLAKSFMAGLLRHAAEITAITNQTVNSYKRLVPGLTRTSPSASCSPPGCVASPRATSSRSRPTPTCSKSTTACWPSSASSRCRSRCPTRCARWKGPSWSTRRSASTSSSGSCATSARSGGPTRPTSRRSRSTAT
jgi:glutamine synthetase